MNQERIIKALQYFGQLEKMDQADHMAGSQAIALGLAMLLQRTGWRPLTQQDKPSQYQNCLIWMKGADHPAMATMNVTAERTWYFVLANSGTAKRGLDEVTHWMPLPGGPS